MSSSSTAISVAENSPFHFDIKGRGLSVFLGPTEARLMELAWRLEELTVKKALVHLGPDEPLAYTTVMTVLNRLAEKELLERRRDGRNFVYRPTLSRDDFIKDRVQRVLATLEQNFPDFLR